MRGIGIRVLVVGAGIAGLATARALRAWGADVEIAERSPEQSTGGAGVFLPGNATRALDRLGLGDEVAARAVRVERQRIRDHRGRPLVDLDVADLWHGVGPCLAMPHASLRTVLLDGAKDVPIRWECTLRSLRDTGDDVRVAFADGGEADYDLVIGADGVHSAVRRMIFGPAAAARPIGQHARRFLAAWPDPGTSWSAMVGSGTSVLTIPVGEGQIYCYLDGPLDDLSAFAEPVPSLLAVADVPALPVAAIEEVSLPRWHHGLILLVGDAAHAASPNMAQGAAMAVEDALVLTESLSAATTITEALHAFELRRRPRTEWVRSQTHRRDRSRNLPAPVRGVLLRRFGEKLFHANYQPLRDRP